MKDVSWKRKGTRPHTFTACKARPGRSFSTISTFSTEAIRELSGIARWFDVVRHQVLHVIGSLQGECKSRVHLLQVQMSVLTDRSRRPPAPVLSLPPNIVWRQLEIFLYFKSVITVNCFSDLTLDSEININLGHGIQDLMLYLSPIVMEMSLFVPRI